MDPECGDKSNTTPLIAGDFTFLGSGGESLSDIDNFADSAAAFNQLCLHHQKNNDNYQTLTYHWDTANNILCPTQCCLNIARRACRLHLPAFHPVAIYYEFATKQHEQIKSEQVAFFLHMVASNVFNLSTSHQDRNKWPCHFIRVTAAIYCIELIIPTHSSKIDFAGGATLSSSTYAIHSILQRHTSKLLHSTLIPPLLKNSDHWKCTTVTYQQEKYKIYFFFF
jgi:hypothetical protein